VTGGKKKFNGLLETKGVRISSTFNQGEGEAKHCLPGKYLYIASFGRIDEEGLISILCSQKLEKNGTSQ